MKQYQIDRFWSRVNKGEPDECWEWTGGVTRRKRHDNGTTSMSAGYGLYAYTPSKRAKQKHVYTHRLAYELLVDQIPAGMTIDHLCFNTKCCNPAHMEVVTQEENSRRGTVKMWSDIKAGLRSAPKDNYSVRTTPRSITVLGSEYSWCIPDIKLLLDAGFTEAQLARKFKVSRQWMNWYIKANKDQLQYVDGFLAESQDRRVA